MKMMLKNQLDERQEQELLRIEHCGCWLAFWGLLAVIAIESFVLHAAPQTMAGEWLIFMALSIYIFAACMKHRIWSRTLQPNGRTNLAASAIAAAAVGILMAAGVWRNYPDKPLGALAAGLVGAVFVFVPCILLLTISANKYKKDVQREEEAEDIA